MNRNNARLLRFAEVKHRTGLSKSSLYAQMQAGQFPRPVRLTKRCVAWSEDLVSNWIAGRLASRETV